MFCVDVWRVVVDVADHKSVGRLLAVCRASRHAVRAHWSATAGGRQWMLRCLIDGNNPKPIPPQRAPSWVREDAALCAWIREHAPPQFRDEAWRLHGVLFDLAVRVVAMNDAHQLMPNICRAMRKENALALRVHLQFDIHRAQECMVLFVQYWGATEVDLDLVKWMSAEAFGKIVHALPTYPWFFDRLYELAADDAEKRAAIVENVCKQGRADHVARNGRVFFPDAVAGSDLFARADFARLCDAQRGEILVNMAFYAHEVALVEKHPRLGELLVAYFDRHPGNSWKLPDNNAIRNAFYVRRHEIARGL